MKNVTFIKVKIVMLQNLLFICNAKYLLKQLAAIHWGWESRWDRKRVGCCGHDLSVQYVRNSCQKLPWWQMGCCLMLHPRMKLNFGEQKDYCECLLHGVWSEEVIDSSPSNSAQCVHDVFNE